MNAVVIQINKAIKVTSGFPLFTLTPAFFQTFYKKILDVALLLSVFLRKIVS